MKELTRDYVKGLLPERMEDSNKATFGSVLNVSGSVNYRGAACLSSLSALKVGAGYVTLACLEIVASCVTSFSPDIVIIPLLSSDGCIAEEEHKKIASVIDKYSVLSIGCGLSSIFGDRKSIRSFFFNVIASVSPLEMPVIIDADGLNLLAELPQVALPRYSVLTPHPKELSRLLKVSTDDIQSDRIGYAEKAARKYSAVIVLKGHRTIVTDGDSTFVNMTGNSALAKAGSGDILTGMVSGFCAQGLSALDAACLAVYLHGKTGDLARDECSAYSVLASDLLRFIPCAIKTLQ